LGVNALKILADASFFKCWRLKTLRHLRHRLALAGWLCCYPASMARLLIVSHCPSPHTQAMTEAVARGARHPDLGSGHEIRVAVPLEAGEREVLWAEGVILGTTENFGYMSGALKDFFDRIYYPCLERTAGLPWAVFIRAGNDGSGALSSIERIVTGLAWKRVQAPLLCRGTWDEQWLHACEELGMTVMAGLDAGVY